MIGGLDAEMFGLSGKTLTPKEKTCLLTTLPILSADYKSTTRFWGKVEGMENDYLIVQLTGEHLLKAEHVFSSDGGLTWHLLDKTTEEQRGHCDQLRGLFTGHPEYELRLTKDIPPVAEDAIEVPKPTEEQEEDDENELDNDDEGDEEEPTEEEEGDKEAGDGEDGEADADGDGEEQKKPAKKPQKKVEIICVKEVTRLADFVEQTNHHCHIVPRGAYLLDEHQNAVVNKTFDGLDAAAAGKLSSYFHCREPIERSPGEVSLETERGDPNVDFLDPIVHDIPKGVWVLKFDATLGVSVASNLLYEGWTFYHKPGTPHFGQYYFGNGERNLDLCFML